MEVEEERKRRPSLFAVLNPTLSKACHLHHDLGCPPLHLASR